MTVPETGTTADRFPAAPGTVGRGLLPLLFLGNAAMFALYMGVGSVLLPLQIEHIDPSSKVTNLGIVAYWERDYEGSLAYFEDTLEISEEREATRDRRLTAVADTLISTTNWPKSAVVDRTINNARVNAMMAPST